jgi:hypothetical protein
MKTRTPDRAMNRSGATKSSGRKRPSPPLRRKRLRRSCPICRRSAVESYWPFCSARCKEIDLGRWLGERYRIPTETPPETESDSES